MMETEIMGTAIKITGNARAFLAFLMFSGTFLAFLGWVFSVQYHTRWGRFGKRYAAGFAAARQKFAAKMKTALAAQKESAKKRESVLRDELRSVKATARKMQSELERRDAALTEQPVIAAARPEEQIKDVLYTVPESFAKDRGKPLTVCFGTGADGKPIYLSFIDFCHMILGGMTNSGKSVAFHSFLVQLITGNSPDMLKIFMADFKEGIELNRYRNIPHMYREPAFDVGAAFDGMIAVYREMNRRLARYRDADCANIQEWNAGRAAKDAYVLIVIDETQDLFYADLT